MKKVAAVLFLVGAFQLTNAQNDTIWQKLRPYFSVPDHFADSFGTFRSPLKFYNGEMVKTRADWHRRRKEIITKWNDMLGHWPPLIENPLAEIIDTVHQENFTRYHIRFFWRADEKTSAYILVPDAPGIKAAVIADFYEPETAVGANKPYGQFALYLVRRGFIAMSIGVDAYYNGAPPNAQFYPNGDSATVQPLYMLAYLAANSYNLLSHWKDVDKNRIGIVGHSYGSKWAMFASCFYEKFACAVWCDGGIVFDEARPNVNYWDPWYLGYYPPPWNKDTNATKSKGIYPYLVRKGYDLTELHALMAPRPFMVSGGSEDQPERWKALNHTVAINRLLGYKHRVGMTNRKEHQPDEQAMEQICLFFEYFLRPTHH